MSKRKHLAYAVVAAAPVLGVSAFLGGSSAWAAACITDPVSVYTAPGFSCNVGPVTFSHISVTPSVSGSGSVTLTDFIPFMTVVDGAEEYGLDLTYTSSTGTTPDSAADVAWIYDVSGVPHLTDARFSKSLEGRLNLYDVRRDYIVGGYQGSI